MEWDFLKKPIDNGWYAALICYDIEEGVFPIAAYWDGEKWNRESVMGFGTKCESENEAAALAYAHDVGG